MINIMYSMFFLLIFHWAVQMFGSLSISSS